ncbi:MAG: hypothetical protein N2Z57_04155 [Oscillospiraceae bacterium]|nr:hypothetical protein [Oscillospiraceae bacterium]
MRPARQSSAAFLEDATSYQVKGKKIVLTNLGKHLISLNKKRLSADEVIKANKFKDLLFVVKLE